MNRNARFSLALILASLVPLATGCDDSPCTTARKTVSSTLNIFSKVSGAFKNPDGINADDCAKLRGWVNSLAKNGSVMEKYFKDKTVKYTDDTLVDLGDIAGRSAGQVQDLKKAIDSACYAVEQSPIQNARPGAPRVGDDYTVQRNFLKAERLIRYSRINCGHLVQNACDPDTAKLCWQFNTLPYDLPQQTATPPQQAAYAPPLAQSARPPEPLPPSAAPVTPSDPGASGVAKCPDVAPAPAAAAPVTGPAPASAPVGSGSSASAPAPAAAAPAPATPPTPPRKDIKGR